MSDKPCVGELVTNDAELYVAAASAFETSATVNRESLCFWLPANESMILFTFDEKGNAKLLTRLGFVWVSCAVSSWLRRCTDE